MERVLWKDVEMLFVCAELDGVTHTAIVDAQMDRRMHRRVRCGEVGVDQAECPQHKTGAMRNGGHVSASVDLPELVEGSVVKVDCAASQAAHTPQVEHTRHVSLRDAREDVVDNDVDGEHR